MNSDRDADGCTEIRGNVNIKASEISLICGELGVVGLAHVDVGECASKLSGAEHIGEERIADAEGTC